MKLFKSKDKEPDVSEPIKTIINLMKEHPKRFEIKVEIWSIGTYHYSVIDNETDFSIKFYEDYINKCYVSQDSRDWITDDEYEALTVAINERVEYNKDKAKTAARQEVMKIYGCKTEE